MPMTVQHLAQRARIAAQSVALSPTKQRQDALYHIAAALRADKAAVLAANQHDIGGPALSPSLQARLTLTDERLEGMVRKAEALAEMEDPVGQVLGEWERPNGLKIRRVVIALGVLGLIFEHRLVIGWDAALQSLWSGNAILLCGGAESAHSMQALHEVIQRGLRQAGLPEDAVLLIPHGDAAQRAALLQAVGLVDFIIPRGDRALTERIKRESRVPVLAHAAGLCHSYIHAAAEPMMARRVLRNAKLRSPGICGATETLLIDAAIAPQLLPLIVADLSAEGCSFRANEAACALLPTLPAAIEEDFATEWLDKVLNIAVVANIDEALAHIARFSSHHTEAILTEDEAVARYFMARIPSAIVMWNSSTQFSDGGEFGLGGEVAIVAERAIPRGPIGPFQLTSYRYEVHGAGHIRP